MLHKKKPTSRYIETEKTRNRLTKRTVEVFDDLNGIDPFWVGIKALIRVERTGTRGGKPYHEVFYNIKLSLSNSERDSFGL
ncbi:hypothetical protein [Nostoc sp.]|uniref:hypothetical protein n=1 Tax=Nostoc sp. TaxID=1180 RepID=UPI002FF61357